MRAANTNICKEFAPGCPDLQIQILEVDFGPFGASFKRAQPFATCEVSCTGGKQICQPVPWEVGHGPFKFLRRPKRAMPMAGYFGTKKTPAGIHMGLDRYSITFKKIPLASIKVAETIACFSPGIWPAGGGVVLPSCSIARARDESCLRHGWLTRQGQLDQTKNQMFDSG